MKDDYSFKLTWLFQSSDQFARVALAKKDTELQESNSR